MQQSETTKILQVRELTFLIKQRLKKEFQDVWVEGEIGDVKKHPSGCFLTLKDEAALIKAVIWSQNLSKTLKFSLDTGVQVLVHGYIDVYPKSGQYQLVVDRIEPKGLGLLQKRFEELKEKLAKEGLFSEERKRPLPYLPKCIGVVTALQGAAIYDILTSILERFPKASILVRPSRVQGDGAAAEIAQAIAELNKIADVEVVIIGRGGGSLEDLWAFNEEIVARAIAASGVPVISAVGHEVDYTIADFVADQRAKTPTHAGEIVLPHLQVLQGTLDDFAYRIYRSIQLGLKTRAQLLNSLQQRRIFFKPFYLIQNYLQELVTQQKMLQNCMLSLLRDARDRLGKFGEKMATLHPAARLANQRNRVHAVGMRMQSRMETILLKNRERFGILAEKLEGRSPVAILGRGYSLTRKLDQYEFITNAEQLKPGDRIETLLHKGKITSIVE